MQNICAPKTYHKRSRSDPCRGRAAQVRAARGWPEKTNPGDGDRKSMDERNLARRTGYRLDQPPPETR
ncbi:hypothetical protein [Oryza sativa Japonica Group]|uniref:Uncharacterized protein P0416D03.7 n=1 Tax=Oryza sativa subsp. japonica TaxID=39947 RepID=Q5ZDM2_ORYSJ|nr:hypothetical protein [Oryza sativa Japonica Group]